MSNSIGLFHLHFYTKFFKEYEEFFVSEMGFSIKGRFSKDEGLLDSNITWDEIESNNIKLRLIEIEKGAVNIVLMPAKFEEAKLEHFGFLLSDNKFKEAIEKANELGLHVRENPHRTFISSKLGFRIEIHSVGEDGTDFPDTKFDELFIKDLVFSTDKPDEFKKLLNQLFEIEVKRNEFKIRGSNISLVDGKFSLRSFSFAGREYNLDISEKSDLLKGLPIEL